MQNTSDNEIRQLWHDSSWKGSFTGVKTFQTLLKTDKNIDISENRLYQILKEDSLYLKHLKPKRKIVRRSYNLNFYGELVQSDLGFMFNDNGFNYFLVLIDCYSLKVFCEPLKTKKSEEVFIAFEKLLKLFKFSKLYKFEVDQGTEFALVKKYCLQHDIIFKYKFGNNKASFAEWIILMIKRRLYKILRDKQTQKWTTYIKTVASQFNELPQKKIGLLRPNDINSVFDTILVNNNTQVKYSSFKNQQTEQSKYEHLKNKLQVNDFVYVDLKQELFGKSFDIQERKHFHIL